MLCGLHRSLTLSMRRRRHSVDIKEEEEDVFYGHDLVGTPSNDQGLDALGTQARDSIIEDGSGTLGSRGGTYKSASLRHDKEKKIGHRRVDDAGQVTYKKKPTSELMATMQLGIGQSITSLTMKPKRDLLLQDFTIVETVFFPREGSNLTPAHHYSDFRLKTYAPIAFRYFRELFSIQPDDFLLSLCNEALMELSNPGASGSIFYLSADDEFIIKTVQHKEADFLQKLLPGYYMNLNQNPRTLLPKFYGLYCYQCGGKNIRFAVMNNLLPSAIKLHEKYDLKGSTYKRKASKRERAKRSPTLKDLDFMELHPEGIMLEADTYNALIKTIERDCRVLYSFKIMDYSLLLGVHNLDQAAKEREAAMMAGAATSEADVTINGNADDQRGMVRGRSVRQRVAQYSTAMEAIQARSEPLELDNEDIPPGGIPARNSRGERLLLYIGIIDILQSYRLKKKLEHAMKAVVTDGDTISVHRPGFYASRFQSFFKEQVFKKIPSSLKHSPSKKKGVSSRGRSLTAPDTEGRAPDKYTATPGGRGITDLDAGAVGGRPDLLPDNATPPKWSLSDPPRSDQWGNRGSRSTAGTSGPSLPPGGGDGEGGLAAGVVGGTSVDPQSLGSPVHSFSESTPTHTECTEGTPSFTTSSPSCSSDMLDSTPALSSRSGGSRLGVGYGGLSSVDNSTEQIQIELSELHQDAQPYVSITTVVETAEHSSSTLSSATSGHASHVTQETVHSPGSDSARHLGREGAASSPETRTSQPEASQEDCDKEEEVTHL